MMMVPSTLLALLVGLVAPIGVGIATANDKLSPPTEAIDTIVRFCVDTGAKADKLEAILKEIRLPQHAIQVEQHGNVIEMRLRLDDNQRVWLNYERGGIVAMCRYDTYLEYSPATFELGKKRLGFKREFSQYKSTTFEPEPIVSPPGTTLLAIVETHKMEASKAGSISVTVMPAPTTN